MGSGPSTVGAGGKADTTSAGGAKPIDGEMRPDSSARATIVQLQSFEGQTPVGLAAAGSRGQSASCCSVGERQQQIHGVAPHARPSHCHEATAGGTNAEHSSVTAIKSQIVRRNFTGLLWPAS